MVIELRSPYPLKGNFDAGHSGIIRGLGRRSPEALQEDIERAAAAVALMGLLDGENH